MFRSGRRNFWLLTAALATAFVAWRAYALFAMPTVEPHSGDGRFEKHCWRLPYIDYGLPIPGYTIDFEDFNLGQPFEATYRVERLPDLPNKLGVYLSIVDPAHRFRHDEAREPLAAAIEISVLDQNGKVVCEVKQPIAKMWWAHPEGGRDTFGLHVEQSFFVPTKDGRYEIRVRYRPDPALSGVKGFIHIRCGGSI